MTVACFLLVNLHIDMGLEAVLPGPQNALYVMLCYVLMLILADGLQTTVAYSRTGRTNVLNALIKTAGSRVVKHLKIRLKLWTYYTRSAHSPTKLACDRVCSVTVLKL